MPLIDCPDCGSQVSDKADACPKCGYPVRRNLIKESARSVGNSAMEKMDDLKPRLRAASWVVVTILAILFFLFAVVVGLNQS